MRQTESDHNFNAPEFITRLKAQEHTAITLIVKTYTEHLYRTALGLGFNRLDAQEITQAVWVTFFDIIAKFKEKSHVRTFLFGILYNKASELRREQKNFKVLILKILSMIALIQKETGVSHLLILKSFF